MNTTTIKNGRGAVGAAPALAQEAELPVQSTSKHRRPRGTGSLITRVDAAGRKTWFAKFRNRDGQQIQRKLGLKREPGSKIGLSQTEAEREMRRLIEATWAQPTLHEKIDVAEAGRRYLEHLRRLGRKPSTIADYESHLRVHLGPYFSGRSLDKVDARMVERFIESRQDQGKAPKTIGNFTGLLSAIFTFAIKRGWATANPVAIADKPRSGGRNHDLRALDLEELNKLIAAAPDDLLGPTDRLLYLVAAMTGLRRGELCALRWRDVDFGARIVRVRQSYTVRGGFGTPKSERSSRAVPAADEVLLQLKHHRSATPWNRDDDLVFAHPQTGKVYDPTKLRKRFKEAVRRAGIRDVRFHDLRHVFATRMAAAGTPLRTLQAYMGHESSRTTEIYAAYAPDPTQGAAWAAKAFGSLLTTEIAA